MDDAERDEILYRLDERTGLIRDDIVEVKEQNTTQDKAIAANRRLAGQNRSILNAMTFGLGAIVTTGAGKLAGLIKL